MGIEIGLGWLIAATAVTAGATIGTAAASARQERKQQKKLLSFQEQQVVKAEQKVAQAETLATQRATETAKKRKRSVTQTIFTSPLGISEETNIGVRSLLGGG